MIDNAQAKDPKRPFRIPVDRVFTMEGFGTVITGTLIEGVITAGQDVFIYPEELPARVRSLQVHGENVEKAQAGQRVAVNLASLKKDKVQTGRYPGGTGLSLEPTYLLDVRLKLMEDTVRTVENGAALHLYHGTRNLLCKAILLDRDRLKAGEGCYAQLRLGEKIAVKAGDRFVVRFFSPIEDIGRGNDSGS